MRFTIFNKIFCFHFWILDAPPKIMEIGKTAMYRGVVMKITDNSNFPKYYTVYSYLSGDTFIAYVDGVKLPNRNETKYIKKHGIIIV